MDEFCYFNVFTRSASVFFRQKGLSQVDKKVMSSIFRKIETDKTFRKFLQPSATSFLPPRRLLPDSLLRLLQLPPARLRFHTLRPGFVAFVFRRARQFVGFFV